MAEPEKNEVVEDEYVDTAMGRMRVAIKEEQGIWICENGDVMKPEDGACPHCGSTEIEPFVLLDPD